MSVPEPYLRVQATYRGRLGVEVGVFVAVDHLRRAGVLTAVEQETYLDVDDWFHEHLPNPDFYADGNTLGAVTWFKTPVPEPMQVRVDSLCAILRAHDVAYDVVRSADPGELVYEDDYQVGVVPSVRGEPTPPLGGVALAPTTPGSKRAVSSSTIRQVLFAADVWDPLHANEEAYPLLVALRRNGYGVGAVEADRRHLASATGGTDAGASADPASVLLVADTAADVADARAAGLAAEHWRVDDGHGALVGLLARHGVDARLTAGDVAPG